MLKQTKGDEKLSVNKIRVDLEFQYDFVCQSTKKGKQGRKHWYKCWKLRLSAQVIVDAEKMRPSIKLIFYAGHFTPQNGAHTVAIVAAGQKYTPILSEHFIAFGPYIIRRDLEKMVKI